MLNFWVERKSRLCHARGADQHVSQGLKTKARNRICLQWKDKKRAKANPSNFWSIPGHLRPVYTEELSSALLTLLMDAVAPLALPSLAGREEMKQRQGETVRRGKGVQGCLGKRRGSSACQFSADLMPTLKCNLRSSKHQLGKTTFLQLAFSSAVAGHTVLVLFKSVCVADCNTDRWNEGRTFNYREVINVWELEYFKSPRHCFTGSWFLS